MRVLVANEPLAYREALSKTLQELRPRVEVRQAPPEELRVQLTSFRPRMVICSQLPEALPSGPSGWLELYPGGSGSSTFILDEERVNVPNVQLVDLLSMLDKISNHYNETEKPL